MIYKAFMSGMLNVQRLGHIAIRVKNIDRAKSFYLDIGMKLIWDAQDWCYLEAGPGKDGLALLGPGYKPAGPHFAFHFSELSEVKQAYLHLKDSGIHVEDLHEHRDGTASFYLKDPEGNWLEMLYCPPEGIKNNQDFKKDGLE